MHIAFEKTWGVRYQFLAVLRTSGLQMSQLTDDIKLRIADKGAHASLRFPHTVRGAELSVSRRTASTEGTLFADLPSVHAEVNCPDSGSDESSVRMVR